MPFHDYDPPHADDQGCSRAAAIAMAFGLAVEFLLILGWALLERAR